MSRLVNLGLAAYDGFSTVISKAHKRQVTEDRKMTEIQMTIQVTKTAQSAKKLEPPLEPAKGIISKAHQISLQLVICLFCFGAKLLQHSFQVVVFFLFPFGVILLATRFELFKPKFYFYDISLQARFLRPKATA